jgi:acyl-coenzyme A synthetase/AMP-(fatty) acid ligase
MQQQNYTPAGGGLALSTLSAATPIFVLLVRRFEFLEGPLPKTGTGKIVKRQLRETLWGGKERRVQ